MSHHHHHCHGDHADACCSHHDECCAADHSDCCHEHEQPDFGQELLELADAAWMELLKDKIKEQIEAASGKHLDQLAKLISTSNKGRWEHKIATKRALDEYREKLADYFRRK